MFHLFLDKGMHWQCFLISSRPRQSGQWIVNSVLRLTINVQFTFWKIYIKFCHLYQYTGPRWEHFKATKAFIGHKSYNFVQVNISLWVQCFRTCTEYSLQNNDNTTKNRCVGKCDACVFAFKRLQRALVTVSKSLFWKKTHLWDGDNTCWVHGVVCTCWWVEELNGVLCACVVTAVIFHMWEKCPPPTLLGRGNNAQTSAHIEHKYEEKTHRDINTHRSACYCLQPRQLWTLYYHGP